MEGDLELHLFLYRFFYYTCNLASIRLSNCFSVDLTAPLLTQNRAWTQSPISSPLGGHVFFFRRMVWAMQKLWFW